MRGQQQTIKNQEVNQAQCFHHLDNNILFNAKNEKSNLRPSLPKSISHSAVDSDVRRGNVGITELHIKNMVSRRCEIAVKSVLENLGLYDSLIELGLVQVNGPISNEMRVKIKSDLLYYELELLEDKKVKLVQKIKKTVVEILQFEKEHHKVKIPYFLHQKFNNEYTNAFISNAFSDVTGITIEHYIIIQKIELAKEMIVYHNKMTLTNIAWQLNYSSVGHFCNQFKVITGLTPSFFKNIRCNRQSLQ